MDGTSDLQPLQPPRGSRDLGHNPPSYDDTIKPSSSSPKPLPFETHLSSTNKAIWSLYVDTAIAEDPHQLYDLICEQAKLPPVCRLRITGRRWPGRTSEDDFDFKLNLTSTLIGMSSYRDEWNELEVVRDGDGVAAYRGGWSTSLKWEHGFNLGSYPAEKSLEHQVEDLEEGRSLQGMKNDGLNEDESSLWTWCQRFCRDPTRIKSFTFQRKLTGFDYQALRSEVNWYLKSMNYEGQTSVNYDVSRLSVKVYSPHWYNHIRENRLIDINHEVRHTTVSGSTCVLERAL